MYIALFIPKCNMFSMYSNQIFQTFTRVLVGFVLIVFHVHNTFSNMICSVIYVPVFNKTNYDQFEKVNHSEIIHVQFEFISAF